MSLLPLIVTGSEGTDEGDAPEELWAITEKLYVPGGSVEKLHDEVAALVEHVKFPTDDDAVYPVSAELPCVDGGSHDTVTTPDCNSAVGLFGADGGTPFDGMNNRRFGLPALREEIFPVDALLIMRSEMLIHV